MRRRKYGLMALPALLLLFIGFFALSQGGSVKEPAVAGSFYPADPALLRDMVASFLRGAGAGKTGGGLVALIAPHAGYQFSGRIAACAYNQLRDRKIGTVILIGPAHYAALSGAAVYTGSGMRTPLGDVRVNTALARSLVNKEKHVVSSAAAFDREHSLEVQLPFLQTVLSDFAIVPVLIGRPTRKSFHFLTDTISAFIRNNPGTIVIASTDLSHYHDYAVASAMDRKMIDAATRMSLEDVERYLTDGEGEMCGGYPVLCAMTIARNQGATHGVLHRYANSGDVTGDRSRVVGYAAVGLYKAPLSREEQMELLALAEKTVMSHVTRGTTPAYRPRHARLLANGATFVTLTRNGSLRGCIGNIQPVMPLWESVQRNAVHASSRDHRFNPVTRGELKDLDVEVTVLSPLERLDDVRKIRIGTHGLYIVKGSNAGILLPQVAEEYRWEVPVFLEQVSIKAGLPRDAWKSAALYTFTADVIR